LVYLLKYVQEYLRLRLRTSRAHSSSARAHLQDRVLVHGNKTVVFG